MFLVNRTAQKAEELAAEIRVCFSGPRITVGYPKDKVDLVLNATSLGLNADDGLPVDESHFSLGQSRAVYDMIYRPAETPLLKAARTAGCRTANGLGMLLYQGAHALEIWSGMSAPVEKMRRWERDLVKFLDASYPEVGKDLAEKRQITPANEKTLREALSTFKSSWQA